MSSRLAVQHRFIDVEAIEDGSDSEHDSEEDGPGVCIPTYFPSYVHGLL